MAATFVFTVIVDLIGSVIMFSSNDAARNAARSPNIRRTERNISIGRTDRIVGDTAAIAPHVAAATEAARTFGIDPQATFEM